MKIEKLENAIKNFYWEEKNRTLFVSSFFCVTFVSSEGEILGSRMRFLLYPE